MRNEDEAVHSNWRCRSRASGNLGGCLAIGTVSQDGQICRVAHRRTVGVPRADGIAAGIRCSHRVQCERRTDGPGNVHPVLAPLVTEWRCAGSRHGELHWSAFRHMRWCCWLGGDPWDVEIQREGTGSGGRIACRDTHHQVRKIADAQIRARVPDNVAVRPWSRRTAHPVAGEMRRRDGERDTAVGGNGHGDGVARTCAVQIVEDIYRVASHLRDAHPLN